MSIRELLDNGAAPAEWKKLAVDSIRAYDIDVIPGTTDVTSSYAVFPGLKFKVAAGDANSNITGAAPNADIQLTFVKTGLTWSVFIACYENGGGAYSKIFHATANNDAQAFRIPPVAPATSTIYTLLSDFVNANLFPAGSVNGDEVSFPVYQYAGNVVFMGTLRFIYQTVADNSVAKLSGSADKNTLPAANLMLSRTCCSYQAA